jgi:hypothetical protein
MSASFHRKLLTEWLCGSWDLWPVIFLWHHRISARHQKDYGP